MVKQSEQVLYLSASSGWRLGDKAAVALGAFFAGGQADADDGFGATALFGVASFGHRDRSLSLGLPRSA